MNIKINRIGNNEYLQFEILNKYNLIHGFTIKKEKEIKYEEVCDDLNLNKVNVSYIIHQAHSNLISIVNEITPITEVDALVTNKIGIPLFIRTADCNSIIVFDKKEKVIANIHSGWKGTIQRILTKTIFLMQEKYNSKSENLIICFFPSIRECHFEVDEDVCELFIQEFKEIKKEKYIKNGDIKEGKQKYLIDTTKLNKLLILNIGIKEENIYITDYCTVCNNDLFYSHRMKDKGRNLTVIELKGEN